MEDSEFEKARRNGRRWWTTWADANDALGPQEDSRVASPEAGGGENGTSALRKNESSSGESVRLNVHPQVDLTIMSSSPSSVSQAVASSSSKSTPYGRSTTSSSTPGDSSVQSPSSPAHSPDVRTFHRLLLQSRDGPELDEVTRASRLELDAEIRKAFDDVFRPLLPLPLALGEGDESTPSPIAPLLNSSSYSYSGSLSPYWLLALGSTGILAATLLSRRRGRRQGRILAGLEEVKKGNAEVMRGLRELGVGSGRGGRSSGSAKLTSDGGGTGASGVDAIGKVQATPFDRLRSQILTEMSPIVEAAVRSNATAGTSELQRMLSDMGAFHQQVRGDLAAQREAMEKLQSTVTQLQDTLRRGEEKTILAAEETRQAISDLQTEIQGGFESIHERLDASEAAESSDAGVGEQASEPVSSEWPFECPSPEPVFEESGAKDQDAAGTVKGFWKLDAADERGPVKPPVTESAPSDSNRPSPSNAEDRLQDLLRAFARDRKVYEDAHEMFDIDKTIGRMRRKHKELMDEIGKGKGR